MPSQTYSFHLAQQAVERGASVVAMRRSTDWVSAIPGLADGDVHVLNSVQNVTISHKNCPTGFDEIVDKLLLRGAL
jgi:hypothetical protein